MIEYNRQSVRLPGFDYSLSGYYFVTVCTYERQCLFGTVVDGKMNLSQGGEIANKYWLEIPLHYQHVVTDTFQIMPDHIHGIIIINKSVGANYHSPKSEPNQSLKNDDRANNNLPLQLRGTSGTLGAIIRGYKIGITKWYRNHTKIKRVWQRNYYEHIIRNEKEYWALKQYIKYNPKKWADNL